MVGDYISSSKSYEWETPQWLFDGLNEEFGFTLDPCASHENHKCDLYFTKDDDGLSKSWKGHNVFMNPPYGRQIGFWVEKASQESAGCDVIVGLIPARTDTRYFHNWILNFAEIRFIKGRVKFSGKGPAPFPSMVVIWRKQK